MSLRPTARALSLPAAMLLLVVGIGSAAKNDSPNTLTDDEKASGWKLLFDGQTTKGWHGFKQKAVPATWTAQDGSLVLKPMAKGAHPSLVTDDEFGDFEFSVEWKISAGANSGIFYRMAEEGSEPNATGIEYQVIDNALVKDHAESQTASAYLVYAPTKDVTRPLGEWNQTRILVKGNHAIHWLNGEKVVEYDIASADWKERVAKTKFKTHPKYGLEPKGHLCLQDHGGEVAFRNVKVRVTEKP